MHTIALLPLVPLSFIAIAFTEHCKKALGTKHALLQCTSGTESAEEEKEITKTKPVSLRFAALRCETAKKKKKDKKENKAKKENLNCESLNSNINSKLKNWNWVQRKAKRNVQFTLI